MPYRDPEKLKEYRKAYYQKNKDKLTEKHKNYRNQNQEKIKEIHKQYYEQNKEKIKEQKKEYYEQNKERYCQQNDQHKKIENYISRLSADNHYQLWDPEQDEILIKLYRRGSSYKEMADRLSRTIHAISSRLQKLHKLGKL